MAISLKIGERIYILVFKNEKDAESFNFPPAFPLTKRISDIIDFEGRLPDKFYYTEGKYKGIDFKKLKEAMSFDKDHVYQWWRTYLRKNKKNRSS